MPDPLLTIVATDIRTGPLLLDHLNSNVEVTRHFTFLDGQGDPLPMLGNQESGHVIPIPDIPPSVRAALLLIDNWTELLVRERLESDG